MRFLLATLGSRGDVEPFVLLAEALGGRGHEVVLALDPGHHEGGRDLPRVTRAPLGDLDAAALAAIVARGLSAPTPAARSAAALRGFFGDRSDALAERMARLTAAPLDLVVTSEHLLFADGNTLPWSSPTAVVLHNPAPREAFLALAGLRCRRLVALSSVFRARGDAAVESAFAFTGFWISRRPRPLPPDVARLLAAGPPPFFLTMGSMVGFDAAALGAAFAAAARRAGRPAIVQRGWAGLSAPPSPDVLVVDEVDYAALFPRCAATFVHGGTGTTAHALHSGRPVAFLPIVGDQELWARNLVPVGNGLGRLDPFAPDPELFLALMRRALEDPRPAQAAGALARMIQGEDGLAAACAALGA